MKYQLIYIYEYKVPTFLKRNGYFLVRNVEGFPNHARLRVHARIFILIIKVPNDFCVAEL